jgi:hypothetical protein
LVLYLLNLGWLIVHYVLAFIAIIRLAKEKSCASLVLLLLPLFYLLFMTAPAGSERFRFPAMPYFYLFSAPTLARISISQTSTICPRRDLPWPNGCFVY